MNNFLLLGDGLGLPQLLRHVPIKLVCGLVGACNRPDDHTVLRNLAAHLTVPFFVQPFFKDSSYPSFLKQVKALRPEMFLCNSYSLLLPDDFLAIPRVAINLHGGAVPEYRGANPIQWSIINGEKSAGITLHEMTSRLDAGNVIEARAVPIRFTDTWLDVQTKLMRAGEELLHTELPSILQGSWQSKPQNEARSKTWPRRKPEDGRLDPSWPVIKLYNTIRALVRPLPGAYIGSQDGGRTLIDNFLPIQRVFELKHSFTPISCNAVQFVPAASNDNALQVNVRIVNAKHPDQAFGETRIILSKEGNTASVHLKTGTTEAIITAIKSFCVDELGASKICFEVANK